MLSPVVPLGTVLAVLAVVLAAAAHRQGERLSTVALAMAIAAVAFAVLLPFVVASQMDDF